MRGNRVPGFVGAVVVDHVVYADPPVTSSLDGVKLFVSSTLPPVGWVRSTSRGSWDWAALDVEVLVVGIERGFAPIDLLKPASCCPIISFPECGEDSHGLELWEWDSSSFIVLVHPDGYVIHRKPTVPFTKILI
ncbi:unnamed protein product [Camellia sinensis]